MAAVLTALVMGALIGLLARPFLDAYVAWKAVQRYEETDALVPARDGVDA